MEPDPTVKREVRSPLVASLAAEGFADATQIGRGGFGFVYRCTQVALDRVVAVKVLLMDLDENRPRFEREQRAMARLTGHPNIVAVLQVGETSDGHPYLAMPYYRRGCIQTRIRTLGPLTVEDTLQLGVKIAGALGAAHALQIVHRDVKPGNVLVTDYGEPALADFGIAQMTGGYQTAAGIFSGSPAFSAPEVLQGEPPSQASDVYGLGATLFAALTGRAPHERNKNEHITAQLLRVISEPVPHLRDHGIAEDVAAAIAGAMDADPRARPSAVEFGEQLQAVQAARGLAVDTLPVGDSGDEPGAPHRPGSTSRRTAHVTRSRNRGNLPAAIAGFVGRAAEPPELRALLGVSRLVTLTGVGGVGKSTLALQTARELEPQYPDGVWLIDVGDVSDGSMLVGTAAAALRIGNQVARPLIEIMVEALGDRHALLVLDNCEQVVEHAAEFVETLLHGCQGLRILTTSREVLGVGGESVLPLSPLAASDAVALFVERARTAKPGFTLTDRNAPAVAKICAQLDGLPLAIELAAARLRAMSVDQIAGRLSDRFGLLTRGRRGAPTRQQTLSWCIDWSFDRCTVTEQRLWTRLSVFAGSFELEAAHAVCDQELTPDDLLDELCALVDKSVLIRTEDDDAVRFQLLGTLREYGKGRLDTADEYVALQRRHLDWYRQLAHRAGDEWFTDEQVTWIKRLRREMPNIQEALQFGLTDSPATVLAMTADMRPGWTATGMLQDGRRWLERALAATPAESSPSRVRAVVSVMMLAVLQTDWPTVTARAAEASALLDTSPDPVAQGLVAFAEGFAALPRGEVERVASSAERGLDLTDDFEVRTLCLLLLAWRHFAVGETAPAVQYAEQALAVAETRGEAVTRVRMLGAVAVSRFVRGEIDLAGAALRRGLRLCLEIGHSWTGAQYLELLAWVAGAESRPRRAVMLMAASAAEGRAGGAGATTMAFAPMFHDACERRARAELSPAEFDAAWAEGDAMGFGDAAAFGLAE